MKILSAVLVLVAAASSFGAVVTFAPVTQTVANTASGVNTSVEVTLAGSDMSVINMYAYTTDAPAPLGFTYSSAALTAIPSTSRLNPAGGQGVAGATYDMLAGGAGIAANLGSLDLGAITVAVPAGYKGTFHILFDTADSDLNGDMAWSGTTSAAITVTPEPMTMALLALGGLFIARRRHA